MRHSRAKAPQANFYAAQPSKSGTAEQKRRKQILMRHSRAKAAQPSKSGTAEQKRGKDSAKMDEAAICGVGPQRVAVWRL
jgi:hypothetical protein